MPKENGTSTGETNESKIWRSRQIARAQVPVLRALNQVLKKAYPKPRAIIKVLNDNGEALTKGLWDVIDDLITLSAPYNFDDYKDSTLIADDTDFPGKINMRNIEAVSTLEKGETSISGYVLQERAKRISSFGRHYGQYILDNWYDLPDEILKIPNIHVALPGTIWSDKEGRVFMDYFFGGGKTLIPATTYLDTHFDSKWHFLRTKGKR